MKARMGGGRKAVTSLNVLATNWPTPSLPSGGRVPSKEAVESGKKVQIGLENAAQAWATPQARDSKNPDPSYSANYRRKVEKGYTIDLNSQAHNWATPAARDYRAPTSMEHCTVTGAGVKHMDQLPNQVEHVFLPSLQDRENSTHGEQSSTLNPYSRRLSAKQKRRLNPAFVDWLMGWLIGWTDCAPVEMESYQLWWRMHSVLLLQMLFRTIDTQVKSDAA
jgi:hypothetical protein